MLGPDLAAEIRSLENRKLGRSAGSTLGLKTARAWLDGSISGETAAAELATLTWQYSRRQRTWFKKAEEFERVETRQEESPEDIAGRIRTMLGW